LLLERKAAEGVIIHCCLTSASVINSYQITLKITLISLKKRRTIMDVAALKAFFMWCTIINAAMLILASIVGVFLADLSFKMNNRFFSISREAFNTLLCSFLALYKIIIIAFNLVPFIALVIIG
jgi:hypothetical protein